MFLSIKIYTVHIHILYINYIYRFTYILKTPFIILYQAFILFKYVFTQSNYVRLQYALVRK